MKIELPKFVLEIINKFENAGYEICVVGGAVRDVLMGLPVDDWDFTTNAKPEEILKLFPKGEGEPDAFYDNKFGTVGISHSSSPEPYEITTFRTEHGYSDRRRPDKVVWGKSLEEDLARRDFTINAMALRLVKLAQGKPSYEFIDPYNGQKDLGNKLIRAVGDSDQRFGEDALRMMRAIRIAAELGFIVEEKTFDAVKKNAALINQIAKERVKEELFKILASPNPYDGMLLLRNSGLMAEILPEMEKAFGIEQKSPGRHHIYDVGTHLLMSLKFCKSQDPLVRFATMIHDIGKPQTYKKLPTGVITFYNHEVIGSRIAMNIADRLRFSKDEREKLFKLVRWHQFTVNENQTDSAIRRVLRNVGLENMEDMLILRVADRLGGGARETSWRLEEFKKRLIEIQKEPFSVKDLKVDGNDVMKTLRLRSGPKVGEILNKLFEEVVTKTVENDRDILLKRIKETR